MGNYTYGLNFGNFKAENYPFTGINQQFEILNFTYIQPSSVSQNSANSVENPNFVYISDSKVVVNNLPWIHFFDGSKSKEGAGDGFFLIDPKRNKKCIVCMLEFDYTNNITEYEALIQGLKKDLDLNIKVLVRYGDYEIIV